MKNIKKIFFLSTFIAVIPLNLWGSEVQNARELNQKQQYIKRPVVQQIEKDEMGNSKRTTNLPKNASKFPYIQEGVPNWCYEQQPWDDNYWGPAYNKGMAAGASKMYLYPVDVYAGDSNLSTVIADNYDVIDAYIKAQTCVDYRTIGKEVFANSIVNGTDLRTTGSGSAATLKKAACNFVDYARQCKVVYDTEYKILPETAWVSCNAPFNVINFSVYMKMTPKNVTGAYYDMWGVSAVYSTKFKKSSIKTNETMEGIVTYTLIRQEDGTWKFNHNSNSPLGQLHPLCDILNGVAPSKKQLSKREKEFNYTWTRDKKQYYGRYDKDVRAGYDAK